MYVCARLAFHITSACHSSLDNDLFAPTKDGLANTVLPSPFLAANASFSWRLLRRAAGFKTTPVSLIQQTLLETFSSASQRRRRTVPNSLIVFVQENPKDQRNKKKDKSPPEPEPAKTAKKEIAKSEC